LLIFIFFVLKNRKEIPPKEEKKEEVQTKTMDNFVPEAVFSLTGPVVDINKDFIIFDASVPRLDVNGKRIDVIETRKITIDESTKITHYEIKTNSQTGKKEISEEQLKLSDLKIGNRIEANSDKDIKDKEEFLAIKIRILRD
jgi:hypothetical protein